MAVIKMKPTSPGQRGVVKVTRDHLFKGPGYAPLLEPQFQHAGRNNNGHITVRHKGGGHKPGGRDGLPHGDPHAPAKRNGSRPHWQRGKDKKRESAA